MKKVATLLVLALVSLALVACGGDDDNGGEPATDTGAATEGGREAGGEDGQAGSGTTIEFEAAEDGGLAYTEDEKTAQAGKATIEFTNAQPIPHDVAIEDAEGEQIAKTDVITNDTATATATLKAGEYTYYCTVPGHREAGMEGTLTVE